MPGIQLALGKYLLKDPSIYPRQVYSLYPIVFLAYFIFLKIIICAFHLDCYKTSSVKTSCLPYLFLWGFVTFTIFTTHLAYMCCPMYSLSYVLIASNPV